MKTYKKPICFLILSVMLFAVLFPALSETYSIPDPPAGEPALNTDPDNESVPVSGAFTLTDGAGTPVEGRNGEYTIVRGGEYTAKGELNGRVIVDAGEGEVTLGLKGAALRCSTGAPVTILSAGKIDIEAKKNTFNMISDERTEADADEEYDAAVWADVDLKISGRGTLIVTSAAYAGIKSKDDLKLRNLTLKVTAADNALRGNDSVTIESGSMILISTESDGIRTKSSDISKKGNQRGDVVIEGGRIDLYAARDGICAAHDVTITGDDTILNVFTADRGEYSAGAAAGGSEYFLLVPYGLYSQGSDYYAYCYDSSGSGVWVQCASPVMVAGGRNMYYGFSYQQPAAYGAVRYAITAAGASPEDGCAASTDGDTVNTVMNAYLITGVNGPELSGDWVTLTGGNGSGKTAYSAKGIKADNGITIGDGRVTILSADDGIHASSGEALENGLKGTGSVTVAGGTVIISAADDGIHADSVLTVTGGIVDIRDSYEGLEANRILIGGGNTYIYARDDGINACAGDETPLITISGGTVDVTTPAGDTDAVDTNGDIMITGGFTLVKGGAPGGMMAGSVDTEGSLTVTGGAVAAFGGICATPDPGSVNTYISNGTVFPAGNYILKDGSGNELIKFALGTDYVSLWLSCDGIMIDGSYTLWADAQEALTWTQTGQSSGDSVSGGFRFGPGHW